MMIVDNKTVCGTNEINWSLCFTYTLIHTIRDVVVKIRSSVTHKVGGMTPPPSQMPLEVVRRPDATLPEVTRP